MDTRPNHSLSPAVVKTAIENAQPMAVRTAVKADAARYIANLAATLFGAGVLGRTALGAYRSLSPREPPRHDPNAQQVKIDLPHPDDEERIPPPYAKRAAAGPVGWLQSGLENMLHTPEDQPSLLAGDYNTSWLGTPAALGIGLPLGLASLYGGYKLTDTLLDSRRKAEKDEEVAAAEAQYKDLTQNILAKHGDAIAEASGALDALADLCAALLEKRAEGEPDTAWNTVKGYIPGFAYNAAGGLTGFAAAYALLSAMAAGKLSYDYTSSRNEQTLTEEALKRRRAQRLGGAPRTYVTAG